MSSTVIHKKRVEKLSSINKEETEFKTNNTIERRNDIFHQSTTSKDSSSNVILPEDLHLKSNGKLNTETEDRLSLLFNERVERQEDEKNRKHRLSEVLEYDDNLPPIKMNFLDRLFHQLTRSPSSQLDYSSDEEFTELDPSEIPAVINNDTEKLENKPKDTNSLKDSIRLFVKNVAEETNIIRRKIDEGADLDPQNSSEKSLPTSTNDDLITSF